MGKNVIHSLCVSTSVPFIARKRCCLRVSSTLKICVHSKTPFYIAPPLLVTPTFTFVNLRYQEYSCLDDTDSFELELLSSLLKKVWLGDKGRDGTCSRMTSCPTVHKSHPHKYPYCCVVSRASRD